MAVSFIGRGNLSTRWKPPTCHKSLTNFITKCWIKYTSHLRLNNTKPTKTGMVSSFCSTSGEEYDIWAILNCVHWNAASVDTRQSINTNKKKQRQEWIEGYYVNDTYCLLIFKIVFTTDKIRHCIKSSIFPFPITNPTMHWKMYHYFYFSHIVMWLLLHISIVDCISYFIC